MSKWTHDFKIAFRNLRDLYTYLDWPLPHELLAVEKTYPLFVPMKLAQKIKVQGPEGILAKEFLPNVLELDPDLNAKGMEDPIGDKAHYVAPQLIHRYPSRALFTVTSICPVHCRYCFRKNELNPNDEIFQRSFSETLAYIQKHPEISEIIFTGGDPLTLSNDVLEKYLGAFAELKTIKDIRLHTRYPVIMPSRLDDGFMELIEKFASTFRTLTLGIHANHKDEFDEEANTKIKLLSRLRPQLLSQTVLLSGVNDSTETLLELFEHFLDLGVRPYYLHHPDQVRGGMHFTLPLYRGRKIYAALRKSLPGWALPQYVIDVPGGEGKISAFNPETFEYSGQILNLDGDPTPVQEPDFFN